MEADGAKLLRCTYEEALDRLQLLELLAPFDPHVAGTPPLGIDLPTSDIDVLVHVDDTAAFADRMWGKFADLPEFAIWQWTSQERAVVTRFETLGWEFEIFASPVPVRQQPGWRHFMIEKRLLDVGGSDFRDHIMTLRKAGMKTEPAFARHLQLAGNPYQALLDLESMTDPQLAALIATANRNS